MTYSESRINELKTELNKENQKIKKLNIAHIASICAFVGATICACAFSAFIPAALIFGFGLVSTKIFLTISDSIKSEIKNIKSSINIVTKKFKDELIEEKFYTNQKQNKINYTIPKNLTPESEASLEK